MYKVACLLLIASCLVAAISARGAQETYTSETLFVIPWSEKAGGFSVRYPTQGPGGFMPPIRGPDKFDVDLQGNIYIGSNAEDLAEVRKYGPDGTLLWRIQGVGKYDTTLPLEERKFAGILSMCCDNDGNLYITELSFEYGDKIAKWGPDGKFLGFIATGLDKPHSVKRWPGGGISFRARWEDGPRGPHYEYPFVYRNGVSLAVPGAGTIRGPDGLVYGGHYVSTHEVVVDRTTSPPLRAARGLMNEIMFNAYVPRAIEQLQPSPPVREIRIPYPHKIYGQTVRASDAIGYLYITVYIKDKAVPAVRGYRCVKLNPLSQEIVAEIIIVPGGMTVDRISYSPVVVPETGDVYECPDLPDGLHVIKHSIKRD